MISVADGRNNWSQEWQTILFIRVTENMVGYPTEDDARRAFENEVARAETILERTKHPAGLPNVDEQVIGTFMLSTEDIIPLCGFRRRTFTKRMRRP
jgi:hypothetical protein